MSRSPRMGESDSITCNPNIPPRHAGFRFTQPNLRNDVSLLPLRGEGQDDDCNLDDAQGCASVARRPHGLTTAGMQEVERCREHTSRRKILSGTNNRGHDYMDVGGTSPGMGEGRTMQEQLSRTPKPRVTHGAVTEEVRSDRARATQLPRGVSSRGRWPLLKTKNPQAQSAGVKIMSITASACIQSTAGSPQLGSRFSEMT